MFGFKRSLIAAVVGALALPLVPVGAADDKKEQRKFYVTKPHDGTERFRPAPRTHGSLWEIFHFESALQHGTRFHRRGFRFGPPSGGGWIRTGNFSTGEQRWLR
jgi:hypothetical protein